MKRTELERLAAEIDDFLAVPKSLSGSPPIWADGSRSHELQASWPIVDNLGAIRANLRFKLPRDRFHAPTVQIIFEQIPICRLDVEPDGPCKDNPVWAAKLGLPAVVCGSHFHSWENNRDHIVRSGEWKLPAREPIEPSLKRPRQMLPWICDRTNILLEPDQRGFDMPPRSDLFEGS
ncbi:hypothetical protein [Oceanicaulis alexandrii]|uniref:hypothetical protein n=1 Tax=Oceanicaulis alexandrii TaxID=153233 RepID=UPI003B5014F7|tara:strand:- start:831 stop:1361 length:531 start_codon:yes stop_codon:yes gene_type:complete